VVGAEISVCSKVGTGKSARLPTSSDATSGAPCRVTRRLEKVTSKKLHIKTEAKFRTFVTVPRSRIRSKRSRQSVAALLIVSCWRTRGNGAPGRIRTCDLSLRSRAASSPFSTCVPIVSSPLHQFREPAFAQRQNLFSCNYIRSERVLLRLCYVQKCGGIYQCVRPTRASTTRWRSSGRWATRGRAKDFI